MAKNRYFRTALISLFTGVVLVGLTLLSSPENARRFHFLSIGQDAPPLVSPTVAIASEKQILLSQVNSKDTITQIAKRHPNELREISINEPALLPESGNAPLQLTEVGDLNESYTQPVRLEETQLLESEEAITVKIDTTQLDERIIHLDEQINRLQDVELKQREILNRSEKLLEEVTVKTVEDVFSNEELEDEEEVESLKTTEAVDSINNNDGPILGVNLETDANSEQDIVEEELISNDSDEEIVSEDEENLEPVLIAERDDTDSTKIYLRFENADILKVFQLLAEVSQSVIFVSPELAGELTSEYRVRDLEEALSMILPVMGYSFEREENQIYIMPVETLKKINGNLELKKSVREKMINVNEKEIQAHEINRRMNPGLQPPDKSGLFSLIDHRETGDHKMGETDFDELTQNLFSGESVLQDDFKVNSKQVPKLTQPSRPVVVQSSYNQPVVKAPHTPRLFKQKRNTKPIVTNPPQNKMISRPAVQNKVPVFGKTANTFSNQNRNQRPQYPVQRRNQLKPVSMPVISVKAF